MEDPDTPRANAITYAMISLAARLVATQSSVLNLWFSRRCYERSRGEMITMIFEKTLGRKIIGSVKLSSVEKSVANDNKDSITQRGRWWRAPVDRVKRLFTRAKAAKEAKEPAAMGKILNLMRYMPQAHKFCPFAKIINSNDVYEVAQR